MASTPSGQPDRTKPTTTRKLRRRARKLPPALARSFEGDPREAASGAGEEASKEIRAKLPLALAPDTEASEEEKEAERTRYRSLAVHQHR
uniref:Uncharacterized protein n=1 Tax=Fagus sylvatica TaxID=28930 RepID=A0A2N9IH50_FAGSY